ncbi:MAG: helix-turn-helix transcriptional regulator [Thermoplasmata archaeon]|nr:helix-turn-helix transcriptional regulator [Thermoplasmata archaeon]
MPPMPLPRLSVPSDIESFPISSVGATLPEDALGCPIRASLGILGRKWALVVLRDIAFWPDQTFGQLLGRSKGLTPRVLTNRLRELRTEELIEKIADPRDDRKVHYRLTPKGKDVVPILMALSAFGLRHLAPEVTSDGRPRTLEQTFPGLAPALLRDLYRFALSSPA